MRARLVTRWNFDPNAKTRRCYTCLRILPLGSFYKCRTDPLGVHRECRPCAIDRQRRYRKHPRHYARQLYHSMHQRCRRLKRYAHCKVEMTLKEWLPWAEPRVREFREKNPRGVASVDRINPDLGYSFDNVRIIDKWENSMLGRVHLLCKRHDKTVDDFWRWLKS
jgi:hypothetical protein